MSILCLQLQFYQSNHAKATHRQNNKLQNVYNFVGQGRNCDTDRRRRNAQRST